MFVGGVLSEFERSSERRLYVCLGSKISFLNGEVQESLDFKACV